MIAHRDEGAVHDRRSDAELSAVLAGLRGRARYDPGAVLVDLAVVIADGAKAISDIAVLADQPALFGPAVSLIGRHVTRYGATSWEPPVDRPRPTPRR